MIASCSLNSQNEETGDILRMLAVLISYRQTTTKAAVPLENTNVKNELEDTKQVLHSYWNSNAA